MALSEREAQRLNESMPVANDVKLGDLLKSLEAGEGSIPDGGVTTAKIADGAVTDEKLANPKVDVPNPLVPAKVIGTTLESSDLGLVGYSQEPQADQLAMYQFTGALAVGTPAADSDAATKKYVDDAIAALTARVAALEGGGN